jgi:hypothetical protein
LFAVDYQREEDKSSFKRQKTNGAIAFEWIIKESRKNGIITDAIIEESEHKFGTIAADGSRVVLARNSNTLK